MLRSLVAAASLALLLLLSGGSSLTLAQDDVPDCNVHPLDTEASAAARIARCAPRLAPAALVAIDKVSPVVEPPELMAKRKANNAAAAAAVAAGAAGGMRGGAKGDAAPGPAA